MSKVVGLVFEKKKALTAKECKDILIEKNVAFDENAKVEELRKLVEESQ